jgi:hypothetical protein
MDAILKESHEDLFLEQGWLLALEFDEGWACFRVVGKEWANLQPWSLGPVAALSNLSDWNELKDSQGSRYFEPYTEDLIYHSFWGVTPTAARILVQFPPRKDLGSMLATPRSDKGDVGYIDGRKSSFWGPYSRATEIFTLKSTYPAVNAYNPLNDNMYNVLMNIDQRHYTYEIISDAALIKDMLTGKVRVKKFTMGLAYNGPATLPSWLKELLESNANAITLSTGKKINLYLYSQLVMAGSV